MQITAADYTNRILSYYAGSFDITRPFSLGGHTYTALASMHAHEDQYVRLVGTQLWAADSHEYTLFDTYVGTPPTPADVARTAAALAGEMEAKFVRYDAPLPPAEHQYTWLSAVLISEKAPNAQTIRAVQQVKHTRFYRFYLRGYSESRILLVDLENRRLYANGAGKSLKKLYQLAFDNIAKAENKPRT